MARGLDKAASALRKSKRKRSRDADIDPKDMPLSHDDKFVYKWGDLRVFGPDGEEIIIPPVGGNEDDAVE